jgi:hypothetical protein
MADMAVKGRARLPMLKGVDHGRAKLTEKQVLKIRASGASGVALAAKYGVSTKAISSIRLRKRWKHI